MSSLFGPAMSPGGTASVEPDRARYQLFGVLPDSRPDTADEASVAEALEACRAACMSHLEPHLDGYIWQRDPFQLEVVAASGGARGLPAHLAGATAFGDNVEDEWFIVWLLVELTRAFPTLTARVWDNDGEFLLIECAFHLPKWVKPEAVANRVWIHAGELHLVPPAVTADVGAWARSSDPSDPDAPSVEAALWLIRGGDGTPAHVGRTLAPSSARDALRRRVGAYPDAARASSHRAFAILPERLARLLRVEPQLVAPAVEAFYERDPDGLRAAARMRHFPPDKRTGALVSLTRCLYGQLVRQRFSAPRGWLMPSPGDRARTPPPSSA